MAVLDIFDHHSHSGGALGAFVRFILRFVQFVLALTVIGLYGVDLHRADQQHKYTDSKWVFAEVVASFSAVTCIIYGIPFIKSYWFAAWDWILAILWIALFGTFGSIYIKAHPTPHQGGQIRMKHAVWVDLTNFILWFISAIYASIIFWRNWSGRTLHTGRAKV